MSNLIGIRRRIKSAKNISQITKAMEMVSASKMRKAQDMALATRPFTAKLYDIMARVSSEEHAGRHALTQVVPEHHILLLMVSTNKGLCGALNVNIHRGLSVFADEHRGVKISVATIGKKAKYVVPGKDIELAARFDTLGETITFEETRSISRYAMDSFMAGTYDAIYLVYPKFISTLQNQVTVTKLLPVTRPKDEAAIPSEYKVEPDAKTLIDTLLPYQVEMTVYQTLLEARASEHSARMIAMKNASDNARDLISDLTLDYNQARQSAVTTELLDVTTARMALNE